jgi:pimeloyl-ACP methyl ester carboxylesterase
VATVKTDDGTSISYKVMGDGPIDVLFVHCWGNSSFAYQEMLKGIDTRGLRLLVPDLRGSGDSDRPNTGYSIERHAKDMMAVAADAKSKRFVVVGHSMGGQIARSRCAGRCC